MVGMATNAADLLILRYRGTLVEPTHIIGICDDEVVGDGDNSVVVLHNFGYGKGVETRVAEAAIHCCINHDAVAR